MLMRMFHLTLKCTHFIFFYFIFELYIIVLVLPNIKMNPPQVHILMSAHIVALFFP